MQQGILIGNCQGGMPPFAYNSGQLLACGCNVLQKTMYALDVYAAAQSCSFACVTTLKAESLVIQVVPQALLR